MSAATEINTAAPPPVSNSVSEIFAAVWILTTDICIIMCVLDYLWSVNDVVELSRAERSSASFWFALFDPSTPAPTGFSVLLLMLVTLAIICAVVGVLGTDMRWSFFVPILSANVRPTMPSCFSSHNLFPKVVLVAVAVVTTMARANMYPGVSEMLERLAVKVVPQCQPLEPFPVSSLSLQLILCSVAVGFTLTGLWKDRYIMTIIGIMCYRGIFVLLDTIQDLRCQELTSFVFRPYMDTFVSLIAAPCAINHSSGVLGIISVYAALKSLSFYYRLVAYLLHRVSEAGNGYLFVSCVLSILYLVSIAKDAGKTRYLRPFLHGLHVFGLCRFTVAVIAYSEGPHSDLGSFVLAHVPFLLLFGFLCYIETMPKFAHLILTPGYASLFMVISKVWSLSDTLVVTIVTALLFAMPRATAHWLYVSSKKPTGITLNIPPSAVPEKKRL